MLVYKLLTAARTNEIIPTVCAPTSLAAYLRDYITCWVELYRIAWQIHNPPDEISRKQSAGWLTQHFACCRSRITFYRVGIDYHLTTFEKFAVHPIHYHSIALLQRRRKTSHRYGEDSENVSTNAPYQEQRKCQRYDESYCYFQYSADCYLFNYLMLSTNLNRRFQRIPEKPGWSGLWLHHINIGLPTIWSSGTNPQ